MEVDLQVLVFTAKPKMLLIVVQVPAIAKKHSPTQQRLDHPLQNQTTLPNQSLKWGLPVPQYPVEQIITDSNLQLIYS